MSTSVVPSTRWSAALALILLLSLVTFTPPTAPAAADSTMDPGRVRGQITDPAGRGLSQMQVIWFNDSGKYLGKRNADANGSFGVGPLAPGRYLFQFVDRRPQYDSARRPQRDIHLTVRANRTTEVRLRMPRGGTIYGTALVRGQRAASARVVAANQWGTSYEVKANKRGEFAIGGLPPANYSVFTWDAQKTWSARSIHVRALKANKPRKVSPRLNTRTGGMSVDLYPMASFRRNRVTVTATNRRTGQWYVATTANGVVSLSGLYPGRYNITVPGVGDHLGRSGVLSGSVRSGRVTFTSFTLTQRGGWLTGTVVDSVEGHPLAQLMVSVEDANGTTLSIARTNSAGQFRVGGSLRSQTGLQVVVRPEQEWIRCPNASRGSVRYVLLRLPALAATAGTETSLGEITLLRHSDSEAQVCQPELEEPVLPSPELALPLSTP